jgi:predicted ATP-binding protein involved in virulence
MLEIAWRCLMLNPFLNERVLIETEGIVLIDEIDLHLHPKWQQRIAYILHEVFPNIQFVLTTHSELVLSSVKGSIIKLNEDFSVEYYSNVYGTKASYALENLMGVKERLPWLQTDIDAYFHFINQGEGKSEQAQLLRTKISKGIAKRRHSICGSRYFN